MREGDSAPVLYVGSIDAPKGDQTPMTVVEAIEICQGRRAKFLFEKAQPHIEKVDLLLRQGDPRAAEHEWKSIVGVEHLPQASKRRVEELRHQISGELTELAHFEQAVKETSSLQPPIKAWADLMQVGQQHQQFLAASRLWRETKDGLHERVEETAIIELQNAVVHLGDFDLVALHRSLNGVDGQLASWKLDFSGMLSLVVVLRQWSESLEALLAQAGMELDARQLESAAQTLQRVEVSLKRTSQQLPDRLAVRLALPEEFRRLGEVLASFKDADGLHTKLRKRLEDTQATTELKQLMDEIQSHLARVDREYRRDFQLLGELAEARYCYFVGKGILQVAGNYDEARGLLEAAARHPDFKARAFEELAEIDKNLLPANQRVSEALAKTEQYLQQGLFWEAYQLTIAVLSEPAEKAIRDELKERSKRCHDQTLRESRGLLSQAVSAGQGNPRLLKEHAARLRVLDSQSYAQLEGRLQLLIHEMEAQVAVENGLWGEAAESYLKAAQEIEQRGGLPDRAREFRELADGAAKQDLLHLQESLEARVLVEELKRQVSGVFAHDPDLRSALALALLHSAEWHEDNYEQTPDDLREIDELGLLKEVHSLLLDAWQQSRQASTLSQVWRLKQRRPAYEQARCATLRQSADQLASERVHSIKDCVAKVEMAQRISKQKLEIVRLLSSLMR